MDVFVTKCGDSYYGYWEGIKEWKGLQLKVENESPSVADKLNGIEWKATVYIRFEARRDALRKDAAWQSNAGGFCLALEKKSGNWAVDSCLVFQREVYGGVPPNHKFSCEEIERLRHPS